MTDSADTPISIAQDTAWMRLAIEQAHQAESLGEVPVGAVLVIDGALIAAAFNAPISGCDPSAHAEIAVLRKAAELRKNYRLPFSTLYVTIEPCTMCMGAMIHSRVQRVVFGAREPRAGAVVSQLQLAGQSFYNHQIEVTEGVLADECGALVSTFFRAKRKR
ncbi:tRNA adenosine(34) deaminase TadA [Gammaproteobacteria bacterium]|jgi:tRNA(adenine34) deaminase|nr:tRNA adenosine(34) deaminase TadA [Gammaproteobacteria bacterium]MBT6317183.1 tRNA adenosine(34) deaminase TadA [Gammaproteobacteria bacterium]MBT7763986.1 tRNA adenosine(34) deaminase TadA [Gammaproteobacteria bacterium]MDA8617798.1 tRNA adenosine(34) deaminase TadA [Gammaproteobacteria bacterium]MDC1268683.1 tRNA adenosine(34) deaminase TadA [Gammaproteobacteria bacterium]